MIPTFNSRHCTAEWHAMLLERSPKTFFARTRQLLAVYVCCLILSYYCILPWPIAMQCMKCTSTFIHDIRYCVLLYDWNNTIKIMRYMGYWHQRADERHGNPPPQGNQELLVVRDKVGRPPGEIEVIKSMEWYFPFSDLTLLVGRQEGHPACKETVCWFVGGYVTRALHDLQLQ